MEINLAACEGGKLALTDASGAGELCPGASSVTAESVEVQPSGKECPRGRAPHCGLPAAGTSTGTEADSALLGAY